MTTVNWAQLTPDERATLNYFCENGVPVGVHVYRLPACYGTLSNYGLMTFTQTAQAVMVDVTPAGLAVWQQGQVASAPPRSVWVAKCGDNIISVHTTSENSRLICEEVSGEKLEWETCDVYPDGTCRMVDNSCVYSVEEWRVLP